MEYIEDLIQQRKHLVLTLLKQTQFLSLHYDGDNSYLFFNGKEIIKFKDDGKNGNFLT